MFESKLNRGKAGGYAPLDTNGKLPLDKLSFNIGSYATTGSNSFFGNQTISGSLILKDGNVVNPTYTAGPYNIVDGNTGEIYFSYSDNPNLNVLFGENDILIETNNSNRTTPIISITGDGSYWTVRANNSWLNGLTSNSITFSRRGGTWNFGKDGILTLNNGIAEIYADSDNGSVRIGNAGPNVAPNAQIILGGPDTIFKIKSGPPLREWEFEGNGDFNLTGSINGARNLATTGSNIFKGNETISGSLYVSGSIYSDNLVGLISSSVQISDFGFISSASQLTSSYDARYTLSGSIQPLPSNLISSSAQISAFGFINLSQITDTGSFATTGSNTFRGTTRFATVGGDEGGEIEFGVPSTNTSLSTRVVTDIWRDRFRIFDGNTKGVFIDLSKAPVGVAGEITWKASGFVNAGTFVQLDNIKVTIPTSGNRGASIGAVSTTFVANISGQFGYTGGGSGLSANNVTYTTTASASAFGWNFGAEGDSATYILTDKTNNRVYRIIIMIGASYSNNFISIERLH